MREKNVKQMEIAFQEEIEIVHRKDKIWDKIKKFIVKNFFPIRCHACRCIDCQLGELDREYWYCPHLKADICSVCCVYDSLAPDWNWNECNLCEHDADRERCPMEDIE